MSANALARRCDRKFVDVVLDLLRRAILLLVAHWYEFRASFGPNDQPVGYPVGYERLIAGYRLRRL
jgi:uncharacterized phiE125 gp8 family phage protein